MFSNLEFKILNGAEWQKITKSIKLLYLWNSQLVQLSPELWDFVIGINYINPDAPPRL